MLEVLASSVKECSDHWLTADSYTEDTELVNREKRRAWSQSTAKGTVQECASLNSDSVSPSWLVCGGWGPAVSASWVIYLVLKRKNTLNFCLKMIHNLLMPAFGFDLYLKNGSFSSVFITICNGKDCFTSLSFITRDNQISVIFAYTSLHSVSLHFLFLVVALILVQLQFSEISFICSLLFLFCFLSFQAQKKGEINVI